VPYKHQETKFPTYQFPPSLGPIPDPVGLAAIVPSIIEFVLLTYTVLTVPKLVLPKLFSHHKKTPLLQFLN
jgi:hypothetical protein